MNTDKEKNNSKKWKMLVFFAFIAGIASVYLFAYYVRSNKELQTVATNDSITGLTVKNFDSPNISQWANDSGYLKSISFNQILNGEGIYMDYRPNNQQCANNQPLVYEKNTNRWICGTFPSGSSSTNSIATNAIFNGDVSGTYTSIIVRDDSHTHTATTISALGVTNFASQNVSQWTNDANYISGVNYAQIANGVGIYNDYRPNNTACTEGQVVKYDATNARWICANDSGGSVITWGSITGNLVDQTDITTALSGKLNTTANFTGDVTGTYDNLTITNDSHTHTGSTISALTTANFSSLGISQWANDAGFITNDTSVQKNELVNIGTLPFTWQSSELATQVMLEAENVSLLTNDIGYITGLTHAEVANATGVYWDYRPNNTACTNDQYLKYESATNRWICATEQPQLTEAAVEGYITNGAINLATTSTVGGALIATQNWANSQGFLLTETDPTLATWAGSNFITNVGTVLSGVWNGSPIGSAYIQDNSLLFADFAQNGCIDGQTIKWNQTASQWQCATDETGGTSGIPAGMIASVTTVQTRTQGTYLADITGNGTEITPLNITLTPKKAGNKVVLEWVLNGEVEYNSVYNVTRNGVILANSNDGINQWSGIASAVYDTDVASTMNNVVVKIIDENSLNVASTYALHVRSSNGTAKTFYLNRTLASIGGDSYESTLSLATATEIDPTATGATNTITVGSMSGGTLFADASADDHWFGLGSTAGKIEFDDQAIDEINLLNANVGINQSVPTHTLDVNGNIGFATSGYINVGATDGALGYGFRDNAGTIEYKDNGGNWIALNSLSGGGGGGGSGLIASVTTLQTRTQGIYAAPISGSGIEITPLNIVFTPKKAGNKVILEWVINYEMDEDAGFLVTRNGVLLPNATDASNNRFATSASAPWDNDLSSTMNQTTVRIIDENSLDIPTTYAVLVRSSHAVVHNLYLNRATTNAGADQFETTLSTGVATEIDPTFTASATSIEIGTPITNATQGSLLFAGATGVLAQNNPKLFWDDSTTRLGIGTTTPLGALDIYTGTADAVALSFARTTSSATKASWYSINAADETIFTTSNASLIFNTNWNGGTPLATMILNNAGQVGIGTAPSGNHMLDVNKNPGSILTVFAAFGDVNGTNGLFYLQGSDTVTGINSRNAQDLAFYTGNTERFRIQNATGNFGIGISSPQHKLDVNGNIGVIASGYLNFGATDGETGYGIRDNAGTIEFKNNAGTWTSLSSLSGGSGSSTPAAYILIRDEKPSGTQGGTATAGSWMTRILNTEVIDTDNLASVSGNQITLAAGTYHAQIIVPAMGVGAHRAKLFNVTTGTDILLGTSIHSLDGDYTQNNSIIVGEFTLTQTSVLEVQHRVSFNKATWGLGHTAGFGEVEVFTVAEFTKESNLSADTVPSWQLNPDQPPAIPNAMDDEFNDSTVDAKWTTYTDVPSNYSISEGNNLLELKYNLLSANTYRSIAVLQAAPSGNWTVRTKMMVEGTLWTYTGGGIMVRNASNNKYLWFTFIKHGSYGDGLTAYVGRSTGFTVNSEIDLANSWMQTLYLEIRYDGTNLYYSVSTTGISYQLIYTEAIATHLGTPPEYVGILLHPYSTVSSFQPIVTFDWFRRTQ